MRFAVSFFAILIAVAAIFAAAPTEALAQQTTVVAPQDIRSLPITERPNRPGHIYGNTVRFFHRMGRGR
ncbi:MAG TPA: hypothetical protein VGN57_06490 [Pirellulaceae bacterium]|jgi:hypothetical protein|nr:hypothetical protein [Pirellulaceae bacterium]